MLEINLCSEFSPTGKLWSEIFIQDAQQRVYAFVCIEKWLFKNTDIRHRWTIDHKMSHREIYKRNKTKRLNEKGTRSTIYEHMWYLRSERRNIITFSYANSSSLVGYLLQLGRFDRMIFKWVFLCDTIKNRRRDDIDDIDLKYSSKTE